MENESVTDTHQSFTSKQKPWYHNLLTPNCDTTTGAFLKKGAFSLVTLPFWAPVPLMQSSLWLQLLCSRRPSLSRPDCRSWRAPASPILPALPAEEWRQNKGFNRVNAQRHRGQAGEQNGGCKETIRELMLCGYWEVLPQWWLWTTTSNRKIINRLPWHLKALTFFSLLLWLYAHKTLWLPQVNFVLTVYLGLSVWLHIDLSRKFY